MLDTATTYKQRGIARQLKVIKINEDAMCSRLAAYRATTVPVLRTIYREGVRSHIEEMRNARSMLAVWERTNERP